MKMVMQEAVLGYKTACAYLRLIKKKAAKRNILAVQKRRPLRGNFIFTLVDLSLVLSDLPV